MLKNTNAITDNTMTTNETDDNGNLLAQNSEFIIAFDAVDTDPNGRPDGPHNKPRIDPVTNQVVVTDVRVKRYFRDQLDEDGHGIYIHSNPSDDGYAQTRGELLVSCVDVTEADEIDEGLMDKYLQNAADVRLFGALLSVDANDDTIEKKVADVLPNSYTGPVQFSPGRSIHPVQLNDESDTLTTVIGNTGEDGERKETGGYGLDDYRIRYGFITMHGVANANAAANTQLTVEDVERMDTLVWRSLKNQTNTRSKRGQEPRLYLRVEYEEDSYHVGLKSLLEVSEESDPVEQARSITDITVDATTLIDVINANSDRIDTVHVNASELMSVEVDGEVGGADHLYSSLGEAVGDDNVHVIDVYDEYEETLPEDE